MPKPLGFTLLGQSSCGRSASLLATGEFWLSPGSTTLTKLSVELLSTDGVKGIVQKSGANSGHEPQLYGAGYRSIGGLRTGAVPGLVHRQTKQHSASSG